ncbi:MAG: TIGR03013 family PEP-CTERM/XrtA system glycosyltransferase [Deltaproteobacteria bacterium]|nr:TIGR03013 family PEP-CTERM/XrtA system glycosyltransferase [Deltaproteobacteria bacterium]
MITLENRFFPVRSAVCFFVEGGIILVSVLASFLLLHKTGSGESIALNDAIVRGIVVAFICQSCMYLLDMYDLKNSQTWGELFFSVLFAVGFVCIGIGLVTYAVPGFGVEGTMYYLTVLFVAVFLLFWRIVFDFYLTRLAPRENILVMGTGETARMVGEEVLKRERLGFRLVGFAGDPQSADVRTNGTGEIVGGFSQVADLVREKKVRKLVVALSERRGGYPVESLLDLRVRGCEVVEWPSFFEKLSGRIAIDNLSPSYFIFHEGFSKSRFLLFFRRVVSLLASVVLLILLSPILLVAALLIKIDSPGPVFYRQERVGRRGKIFRILKFRSMRQDAEGESGPRWAAENDPRITRMGRILRKSRLDEVPQIFNVLRGDLNLVGPRPERPAFVVQLEKAIPYYSLRHTVRPGLTGWAQVEFTYCGTIEESKEKLQYDLFYIKNMSLKLDLLILFRTVKIVLLGRGAR